MSASRTNWCQSSGRSAYAYANSNTRVIDGGPREAQCPHCSRWLKLTTQGHYDKRLKTMFPRHLARPV